MSRRDRRTLVLGVVVMAGLLGASKGVPALHDWRAQHMERSARLRERLAFARDARRMLPSLRDSVAVGRTRLAAVNARITTASTPSVAAAMLGALVEQLAQAADVKISALELRADTLVRSTTTRVTLRLSGEGDIVGLGTFLGEVDARDEPMVVRELSVSQTDPLSADDRAEVLHFDARIEGLAIVRADYAGAAKPPASAIPSSVDPVFADRDPFRLVNRPARVRYSNGQSSISPAVTSFGREPPPVMTIRAIAGGPPWHALIDGIPGQTRSTLVHAGTTLDRLTIRRITRDSVVIRDADTTWVLTFARRP